MATREAPTRDTPSIRAASGRPVVPELRLVLRIFAVLAFLAGILLFVLSAETDDLFSWTIQPALTAAFLGAAYWAALVLLLWSSRQTLWARARPAIPPVLAIAVLLLVATMIHLDRFHRDLFGWFWVSAYLLVPPVLFLVLARQLRAGGGDGAARSPLPRWLRASLALQATVMVGVGVALFVAPETADGLWPWALTPLTARAVGAFLIGFGVAAGAAVGENDLARLRGSALAYLALGVLELIAALRYSAALEGTLETTLYLGFLATVVLSGASGLVLSGRRRQGHAERLAASRSS